MEIIKYTKVIPPPKKKAEERTKEAKNRWGKQNIQHNDRLKLNHIHTFFFFWFFVGCLHSRISPRWTLKVSGLFWVCVFLWAYVMASKFTSLHSWFWMSVKGRVFKYLGSHYSPWELEKWQPATMPTPEQSEQQSTTRTLNPNILRTRSLLLTLDTASKT